MRALTLIVASLTLTSFTAPLAAQAAEPAGSPPIIVTPVSDADALRLAPNTARTRTDGESDSVYDVFLEDPALELDAADLRPSDRYLMLTGTGVREKFWINVYTVGLYLDPLMAHHQLAKYRGSDGKSLSKNKQLFTDLAADRVPKLLRLVMNRDVDTEDMREAFEDSLSPRIKKAARTDAERTRGLQGLAKFQEIFTSRTTKTGAVTSTLNFEELKENTVLIFDMRPGGTLHVAISSTSKRSASTTTSVTLNETIESPLLCAALIDVYLGKDPVSDDAKTAIAKGLPDVLARGAELSEAGYVWPRPAPQPESESDED
ncbi:MAG: hypothetical protein DHS20C15_14480 [Planctomycetota bacterium]|nr:MAG: hypothetical protein DHS20C15_14480 [Planctomycetota bacterium]